MGTSAGPNLISDGLVFGYDTGYPIVEHDNSTIFSKGKPTTNLVSAYNDNHVRQVAWTNSGTWDYNYNASNNIKPNVPNVDMSKCNLMNGETLTVGSQHFGCARVGVSGNTTYTRSVYYFQNRAGASQPYFRTSVNNNNLGNLAYNGSTNTSNWPVNEWIRISVTATVQSNETGCYLSNYLGSQIDDKVWYCATMVEQTYHLSQFADGTRSSTQSLIDLKETTDISTSNVSFDSNAQMTFDGTDDEIELAANDWNKVSAVTVEAIVSINGAPIDGNGYHVVVQKDGAYSGGAVYGIRISNSSVPYGTFSKGSSASDTHVNTVSGNTMTSNKYYHLVYTRKVGESIFYQNGAEVTKNTSNNDSIYINTNTVTIGQGDGRQLYGDIPVVKIHNRVLSAEEVTQNYNAYKNRFGI